MKTRRQFMQALAGLLAVFPLRRALAQDDRPQLWNPDHTTPLEELKPLLWEYEAFTGPGTFPLVAKTGIAQQQSLLVSDVGVPMAADNRGGGVTHLPVNIYFGGKPQRHVVAYDLRRNILMVEETDASGVPIVVDDQFRHSILFGMPIAVKWQAGLPDRIEAEYVMDYLRADGTPYRGPTWPR